MQDTNTKQNSKKDFVNTVFNSVFKKYDLMNDIMSFGIHRLWKGNLIDWLQPKLNSKLIDMAAGTGDVSRIYIERTKFTGQATLVDQNPEMLNEGKKKIGHHKNINFLCASAEQVPLKDSSFDYYIISFGIRNVTDIKKTLKEAYRLLKPGGRFMCLEFSKINNEIIDKFYSFYSNLIPHIGKLVAGDEKPYEYLIQSIKDFYNQEQLLDLMKEAKFINNKYRNLTTGVAAIHSGWKKQ
ncbi:UbiE Methylase involved in ubiquinone/menaquinone biosynthesis [Candidatus Pelagibacterales bacterium]